MMMMMMMMIMICIFLSFYEDEDLMFLKKYRCLLK